MERRHLDKKRLSLVITIIALSLFFVALVTVPIIKKYEADQIRCVDNLPKPTGRFDRKADGTLKYIGSGSWCLNSSLDIMYDMQEYSFWVGIFLLTGYWLCIPLIIKSFNYLFPPKKDGNHK